jgi:hypothetical protein
MTSRTAPLGAGKVALGFFDRICNVIAPPLLQVTAPVSLRSRLSDDPHGSSRAYLQLRQFTLAVCAPGLLSLIRTARQGIPGLLAALGNACAPLAMMLARLQEARRFLSRISALQSALWQIA